MPSLWRLRWWLVFVALVIGAVVLVALCLRILGVANILVQTLAATVPVYVVIGIAVELVTLRIGRVVRRLRGARGCLCITCQYDLRSLPAPGTCPECGQAFPADRFASAWVSAGAIDAEEIAADEHAPTAEGTKA